MPPPPPRHSSLSFAALTVVLVALLGACGLQGVRGLMIQINKTYLEVRDHLDAEDFAALADDGARLAQMADLILPFNEADDYQQAAGNLTEVAHMLEAAGLAEDMEAARAAFLKMHRPCAACHRVYRIPRR